MITQDLDTRRALVIYPCNVALRYRPHSTVWISQYGLYCDLTDFD